MQGRQVNVKVEWDNGIMGRSPTNLYIQSQQMTLCHVRSMWKTMECWIPIDGNASAVSQREQRRCYIWWVSPSYDPARLTRSICVVLRSLAVMMMASGLTSFVATAGEILVLSWGWVNSMNTIPSRTRVSEQLLGRDWRRSESILYMRSSTMVWT